MFTLRHSAPCVRRASAIPARNRPAAALTPLLLLASLALILGACGGGGGGGGAAATPAHSTVALSTTIPPGVICAAGGYSIDYGIDKNGNGVLDSDEVNGTATICNGADGGLGLPGQTGQPGQDGLPGTDGFNALVKLTTVGTNQSCFYGGTQVDVGLDDGRMLTHDDSVARDGVLQTDEIRVTNYLCANGSGVSEGTLGTPIVLTPGVPYHGKVAAGSASYYTFAAPAAGLSLLGLTRTDSDLMWTLYSDAAFSVPVLTCNNIVDTDGDERCTVPVLAGGASYYLAVQEQSNMPNLMDVTAGGALLVAADGYGRLFQVDPNFGDLSFLATTGATDIHAMTYAPQQGQLFSALDSGSVETYDPFAGTAETVTVSGALSGSYTGIATHPTTGDVYVVNESECSDIFIFYPTDLINTGSVGVPPCYSLNAGGIPIAFDGSDALYLIENYNSNNKLWLIDPVGNTSKLVGVFSFSGFPSPGNEGLVDSMAVSPSDGTVIVTTTNGYLGTLDLSDANALTVNYLATPQQALHGVTFVGGGRPPDPPVRDFIGGGGCSDAVLTWRDYPVAAQMVIYYSAAPGIDPTNPSTYDGTIPVDRSDDSATYDHILPPPTYYRIVPLIDGVPGPASAEVFSLGNC